jgi:hypothetical protein
MSNIIVAKIHNQSLGKCFFVETIEEGKELIKSWWHDQFGFPLENTDEESRLDDLEDQLECYNSDDHDNHYTFSIGIVEQ